MRTIPRLVVLPLLAASTWCQTPPCHAEFGTNNYTTGSTMGGPLVAIKLTPPNPLVITRMELFTGGRTGTSTIYAYAHDAVNNQPFGLSPLGQGTFTET